MTDTTSDRQFLIANQTACLCNEQERVRSANLSMSVSVLPPGFKTDTFVSVYAHRSMTFAMRAIELPKSISRSKRNDFTITLRLDVPLDRPLYVLLFKHRPDSFSARTMYERIGIGKMDMTDRKTRLDNDSVHSISYAVQVCDIRGNPLCMLRVDVSTTAISSDGTTLQTSRLIPVIRRYTPTTTAITRTNMFKEYQDFVTSTCRTLIRNGGSVARFPSGASADTSIWNVRVNGRMCPILFYFAFCLAVPLTCIDALATQMVYLMCIQLNITPAEFRDRVSGSTDQPFIRHCLVASIRVIASMLTYSNDSGENFNNVYQMGEYAHAQADCEELTATCLLLFRVLCNSTCAIASELRMYARKFVFCGVLVTSKVGTGCKETDTMHMSGALVDRRVIERMCTQQQSKKSAEDSSMVMDSMVNIFHEPMASSASIPPEVDLPGLLHPLRTLEYMLSNRMFNSVLRVYALDACVDIKDSNAFVEYIPCTANAQHKQSAAVGCSVRAFYTGSQECRLHRIDKTVLHVECVLEELDEYLFTTSFSVNERYVLSDEAVSKIVTDLRCCGKTSTRGRQTLKRAVFCMRSPLESADWIKHMSDANQKMRHHCVRTTGEAIYVMNSVYAYVYGLYM